MATRLEPQSPEWWLARLAARLDHNRHAMQVYQDYYDGRHPLAFASSKFRETFGNRFVAFANNFCPLVVHAVAERMTVTGFRFGGTKDQPADADAWRIWQANQLDAESKLALVQSLIKGISYAIVSPFRNEWPYPDVPLITVEDGMHVVLEGAAGNRRRRRAALKRWQDDDGHLLATLYLPDAIYKYRSASPWRGSGSVRWEERQDTGDGAWPLVNALGVVPVIGFPNRPQIDGSYESELVEVIPQQDAINKLEMDLLVASEFAAYRQRYILNLDLEIDPETGQVRQPFSNMGVDRMLILGTPDRSQDPNVPEPKVGEFEVSDLGQYIRASDHNIETLAIKSRTPPHYFLGQSGTFPSGESIKSAETGLVSKAKDKMLYDGEAWEEVMRTAFRALGDATKAAVIDAEAIWADPESRTEAEHVDALLKLKSLDVPTEQLWEDAGYSPAQIARFRRIGGRAALMALPAASDGIRVRLGNGNGTVTA